MDVAVAAIIAEASESSPLMDGPWSRPSTLRFFQTILLPALIALCVFINYTALEVATLDQPATLENLYTRKSNATRGLIVPMFDGMIPIGISLVQELRRLGNRDLIQVYHCLNELSPMSLRLLHRVDPHIEVIDVCAEFVAADKLTLSDAKHFRNFYIKPLALIHTRLEQVILLDADDIMFMDPARLWNEVPLYQETGTLFFYDREIVENTFLLLRHKHIAQDGSMVEENTLQHLFRHFEFERFGLKRLGPSNRTRQSLAFQDQSAHEQDSSVVVIDKGRARRAMDVLYFLITDWRFRFPHHMWGDKEYFWVAYELSQTPYSFSPHGAAAAGAQQPHDPLTVCGEMAHFFPVEGSTELLHINGNLLINPYTKTNAFNGYDKSFRPSKMDLLLANVPVHVAAVRRRGPTIIRQPNRTCPQECIYQSGVMNMTAAQRDGLAHRIHDTFAVAAEVSRHTNMTRGITVGLVVGLSILFFGIKFAFQRCL
ncbi:unnamed protein product [Aphanomyces euteiches]